MTPDYDAPVERPGQKSIVLILARELASKLSTAAFVTDERGGLVYYNEAAEELLGATLAETAALPARDWRALLRRAARRYADAGRRDAGHDRAGRPAHDELCVTTEDGARRRLLVTALPLFAHADELVGVLIVFGRDGAD